MFVRSSAALLASILVGGQVVLAGCKPDDPPAPVPAPQPAPEAKKPSWWPDKAKYPDGMDWPPPQPPGWDPTKAWPPTDVDIEDPQRWIDWFGAKFAAPAGKPDANGQDGSTSLAKSFHHVLECDPNYKPGCTMFTLEQYANHFGCLPGGCTPYPAADMNRLCVDALDAKTARATCEAMCARNAPKRCASAKLFTPPMHVEFSCSSGVQCNGRAPFCDAAGCRAAEAECPNDMTSLECKAQFLCSCYEG